VKAFAPGGGGSEKELGELMAGRWPGGGGSENAFGVFIADLWFIDMLDIEPPRFPIEDKPVFAADVLPLFDNGFEAGVPQFSEFEAGGL